MFWQLDLISTNTFPKSSSRAIDGVLKHQLLRFYGAYTEAKITLAQLSV
jgi:hypothetical protein